MRKKYSPEFGIQTSIEHIPDVEIEKGLEERFQRAWKRFYKKAKPLVSKTRKKSILPCLKKIQKEKSDAAYSKRVQIRYVSKKMGYGVFAKEDIPPYSVLNHYAGVLKLDKEIPIDNDSTFNFTDFDKYSIDAMKKGNWTRFMNHGEKRDAGTNVVSWEVYIPEGPRIVFTAGPRGIIKGEQLLYSYGDYYWDEEDDIL